MSDFPDLSEHDVGPTRGQHSIDCLFSNLGVNVLGTVPPLETDVVPGEETKKRPELEILPDFSNRRRCEGRGAQDSVFLGGGGGDSS